MTEMFNSGLSNGEATSYLWLLSIWKAAEEPEEMNLNFYLIVIL